MRHVYFGQPLAARIFFGILPLVAFSACSGSSHPSPTAPSTSASTNAQTQASSLLALSVAGTAPAVGGTAQFSATATFSNNTTQAVTAAATWQTSNPIVATVSSTGLVTGMGLGVADIRAVYQGQTAAQTVAVSSVLRGRFAISTTASQGWSSISVTVNGQAVGTLRKYGPTDSGPICDAVTDARLVTTVDPGSVSFSAVSNGGTTWSGSRTVSANGCTEVQLTCQNDNCAPAPAPAPAPTPSPVSPIPSVTNVFYLYGGTGYAQYLGFLDCINCSEFSSNSINNEFGSYGSQFSSTSIWNQFSQYGSQFSSYSACNQFATQPPVLLDVAGRSAGELTLNSFRANAIRVSSIVTWLTNVVCRH